MPNPYPLFSVIGLEIEYMIVDKTTLNVKPCSDRLMQRIAHKITNEVSLPHDMAMSNELVLHVLELKNNPPQAATPALVEAFQKTLFALQPILAAENACLLPTASHPWMNPATETQRWQHDNMHIYQAFDRIFNCHGHGWSNLQSMHINLPFANDAEFNQLHNAVRLLLPFLPAIAASSPFQEGKATSFLDTRLHYYNQNQSSIPEIAGDIIPEFVASKAAYHAQILTPMFEAIRPLDQAGDLQHEWLNSRGAIPKFAYGALEIRLLDTQECVSADIAIALAVFHILKSLHTHSDHYLQHPYDTKSLKSLYLAVLKEGWNARLDDPLLLEQLQLPSTVTNCRDAWKALLEIHATALDSDSQRLLDDILTYGNLSERLLRAAGQSPSHAQLKAIYQTLTECLLNNTPYLPSS